MANHTITLETYSLSFLRDLVESGTPISLSAEVAASIQRGAEFVQAKALSDDYIYGVNTGFGSLCETRIRPEEVETLQYNHVVSHACGVGEIVPERISRFALLIKLLTFRGGHTGVSLETVQRLVDFWNQGAIPTIPKKGTVGASGDLSPLAHMALPLLGLGSMHVGSEIVKSTDVLARNGWSPLRLKAKEGLALTNGVQYINAMAVDCLTTLEEMATSADVIAALSIQAFSGSNTFYHEKYHETSRHIERQQVAARLRQLLAGSNHHALDTCNKSKQDPYSFRCIPQVHGAVWQVINSAMRIIEDEVNGVSDNPLFFPEDDLILFGGNLHGESTAIQMDFACVAASELASIAERRTYQLLSGQRGLPDFLVSRPGLNSGLMIPQYTSAALVNQNKCLSFPASVDTVSTCQLQEDHVSMGGTSGFKLQEILGNLEIILAIELLTAAQAIDMNRPLQISDACRAIHADFRDTVAHLESDRLMQDDILASVRHLADNRRKWHQSFHTPRRRSPA